MDIISRIEAKTAGMKFYYTGKPCKHGHVTNRYVSNNICVDCQSASNRQHWDENRDRLVQEHRERLVERGDVYNQTRRERYQEDEEFRNYIKQLASNWYMNNREIVASNEERKQQQRQYRIDHQDRIREVHKQWRELNRSRVAQHANRYRMLNRPYYNAKQAAYRAQKRLATPGWCEHESIFLLYQESQRISQDTGIMHNVDHIVPLINPKVCGLHCLANLRIIPDHDNKVKNNKFEFNDLM